MSNSQHTLFQLLRELIPNELSMVDEIADLLNVSTGSAYRRIRGQTAISLDESEILCYKYNIPLDSILGSKNNSVNFSYRSINPEKLNFKDYLRQILGDLKRIQAYDQREIIYSAKDIPIFYHFQFKELASFKIFFWLKTFMQFPEFKDEKFSLDYMDDENTKIGNELLESYVSIPSIEIWNDETVNSALKQIDFYYESGLFVDDSIALILCDNLLELVRHIKTQADRGRKFLKDKEVADTENNYKLYYNELTLVDNTILVKTGANRTVYLTHNLLNNLITTNESFCNETNTIMENMMNKANLISSSSEKLRNQYFIRIEDRIVKLKRKFEVS